jgi:hypothetical protein
MKQMAANIFLMGLQDQLAGTIRLIHPFALTAVDLTTTADSTFI